MNYLRTLVVSVFAACVMIAPAGAVIVSGSVTGGGAQSQGGTFILLSTPFDPPNGPLNTLGNNTFQTPHLYAFNEDQNIAVGSEIEVDIGSNVPAGATVASHYVFFDPASVTTLTGLVTFDAPIVGILTSTAFLNATDFLANTAVTYQSPGLRGLEAIDQVSLVDAFTIAISWRAGSPGDYIRVLTEFSPGAVGEVPIPAAAPLFLSAVAGMAWLRRRRKAG